MVMIAILVICPNYSKLISVRGAHVPLSKLEKLQTPLSVRKMDRFHRKYQKKKQNNHMKWIQFSVIVIQFFIVIASIYRDMICEDGW